MKYRRKLRRTQSLGRQDDLPQACSTNALAEGRLGRVNECIWNYRLERSALRFIDERSVRTRDDKIDFGLTEIAQNPLQNFRRFGALRKISAWMSGFDCEPAVARKQYCSCAFAQNHSSLLFAEGLDRRRRTKQSPSPICIA